MSALLEQLNRRQWLWHGNSQQAAYQAVSSGYAQLDQQLAGGFPASGVIDLQSDIGIGELRLLLPYLQQQHTDGRLLVLICPPAQPCADMLAAHGINLTQLLLLRPRQTKDALWAAEQCLQSGVVSTVLLWQHRLTLAQARRLQLAAFQGQATLVLLRRAMTGLNLPVSLSLQLTPAEQGLKIQVHKRRGSWPGAPFMLDMSARWPALCLNADSASLLQRKAG